MCKIDTNTCISYLLQKKYRGIYQVFEDKDKVALQSLICSKDWDVNQGIQVYSSVHRPLHFAVEMRWIEGIQMLIDAKADVNLADYCVSIF